MILINAIKNLIKIRGGQVEGGQEEEVRQGVGQVRRVGGKQEEEVGYEGRWVRIIINKN